VRTKHQNQSASTTISSICYDYRQPLGGIGGEFRMLAADLLNISALRAEAGQRVVQAGEAYYRAGQVEMLDLDHDQALFAVHGSQELSVINIG